MPEFDWLSDADLQAAADSFEQAIERCREEQAGRVRRNVLDPFALAAIAHAYGANTAEDAISYSTMNAVVLCISSALGRFHQQVLGSASGWRNHDRGFDLISDERRLLAEVKNKHNTMNVSSRANVEEGLKSAIKQRERGWTAYLAILIPRNPERYRQQLAANVYEVDGASFYEIVTGRPNAMHEVLGYLCERLHVAPAVRDSIVNLESLPPRQ